jgi:hypothetical protein
MWSVLYPLIPIRTGFILNDANIQIISGQTKHHSKQLWITTHLPCDLTFHSLFDSPIFENPDATKMIF